jgi:hypothetical protein
LEPGIIVFGHPDGTNISLRGILSSHIAQEILAVGEIESELGPRAKPRLFLYDLFILDLLCLFDLDFNFDFVPLAIYNLKVF